MAPAPLPKLALKLTYSLPDERLRGNSRAHSMAKHRLTKKMRYDAGILGLAAGNRCLWQSVKITYHFANLRKIDLDNLAIGMKPFVDGLRDAQVMPDDTPDHVVFGQHTFIKCRKGDEGVEIIVERVLKGET